MDQETLERPRPLKTHDSAPLFVSLYIVLLAFFIMLNTIAIRDQKKIRAASESIAQAFSYKTIEDMPQMLSQAGTELSTAQFLNEMQAIAASFVPVEKLELYTTGNVMEIAMPLDAVFVPRKAELHPVNLPFFDRVAVALGRWQQGLRIEAEILISQPRGSVQLVAREDDTRQPMARVSAISEYLRKKGVAAKSIVPGLKYEDGALLRIRFSVRDVQDATLNLNTPPRSAP